MLPLRDEVPTFRTPIITIGLIVVNFLVWLTFQGAGTSPQLQRSLCEMGLIGAELTGNVSDKVVEISPTVACVIGDQPHWSTVLTSMFMHGGWLHIIGNMWFLWIFGKTVEDSMGRLRFLVFYLLAGCSAAALQVLSAPASPVPMVGASGAIGGVMGAYLVLYPVARVRLLVILGVFITTVRVPAFLMLGYWFVLQLFSGLSALGGEEMNVAFWAHVGGFAAGALLVLVFQNSKYVGRHRAAMAAARAPPPATIRAPWNLPPGGRPTGAF